MSGRAGWDMRRFSYTGDMKERFSTTHLDLRAFAQAGGELAGNEPLSRYGRVAQECLDGGQGSAVTWKARGEIRGDSGGKDEMWLHLGADSSAAMTCQRCLEPVDVALLVDRAFRFVVDEETAAAQDDESQEDLLVMEEDFDLHRLIEDELVLAMPLIAHHEDCTIHAPKASADPDFAISVAGRPNPFAVLSRLKPGGGGTG